MSSIYTPLHLIAQSFEDLNLLSAYLQDALVPVSGLEYDEHTKHFRLLLNRFCWECEADAHEDKSYYARVITGLTFHNVHQVFKKELVLEHADEMINLLTIRPSEEENCIHLIFSGGGEIKLKIKDFLCHLKDLEDPYPTLCKPCHD
jgi:Protein of unknown function (DUF2948).